MTNEELKGLQIRVDELGVELDAIMSKIHDRQTELETLWDRYWKLYGELADTITPMAESEVKV